MNDLNWNFVVHNSLSDEIRISIAEIKNQHWSYGIESQLEWMRKNVYSDDIHLLGLDDHGCLRAYLTLVNILVRTDEKEVRTLGVGGVCVDKKIEHSGFGKQLIFTANEYIKSKGYLGFLLCKESLAEFYRKCEWINVDCEIVYVDGLNFEKVVMTYPANLKCESISIDRNF